MFSQIWESQLGRTELEAQLTGFGYSTMTLTALANASIWDLQCLVAAHLIGSEYGLSQV